MGKPRITIKFFNNCNNTEVIPFYFHAMEDLHKRGQNHRCANYNYDQKAFVAYDNSKIVGIILIDDSSWKNSLTVILGYVEKEYRNKGIYSRLWNKVVEYAQKLGRAVIEGGTHVSNVEMQEIMKHQKRTPTFIMYDFAVPKKTPKKAKEIKNGK